METFEQIWETMTQPIYVIIYIFLIVFVVITVVFSVMLNESRFNKMTQRLLDTIEQEKQDEQKRKELEQEKDRSRFDMLKTIDEREKEYEDRYFDKFVSLKEICDEFRIFAADKLGLFYDIATIREFIAGLAVSKIVILQGMSGTGKTSLAYAFGEFMENPATIIPVQPMWKERTDLLGYYNEFTKRFNETLLLEKIYEANGRPEMYITILDELNIARIEYYFAEFLSLLEIPNPDARYLEVVSDCRADDPQKLKDGRVRLPENMWFIGTANNDDSTFTISDKVYDRAMILNLDTKSEPFLTSGGKSMAITAEDFMSAVNKTIREGKISEENIDRLNKFDSYMVSKFHITFGNRIMKQVKSYLPLYVECGGTELEALDDILVKKILRKLETQNTAYVKSESEELISFIEKLFGAENMNKCKEYIRRIANNI